MNQSITCDHCSTHNPVGQPNCIACGAPLVPPLTPPMRVTEVETPQPAPEIPTPPPQTTDTDNLSRQIKEGAALVGSSLGGLGIGTLLLRTLAEAVAIAVSAFIIGMNAGTANINLRGGAPYLLVALVGGALVGLCVGLVTRRAIFTLLSVPFGTLLGSLVARFLSLNTPRNLLPALFALAGGVLFALIGGRRVSSKRFACFRRARPFLGLLGGLAFGLLGYLVFHRVY